MPSSPETRKIIHDEVKIAVEDAMPGLKAAVSEGIIDALVKLGMSASDPLEMQNDMLYLRKLRKGSERSAGMIKSSAITIAITTGAFIIWEGIKVYLTKGGGQ